jgi:hypothetical protein
VNAIRATCLPGDHPPAGIVELRVADDVVNVHFEGEDPVVEFGPAESPDVVIETDPTTLFSLAAREQSTKEAVVAGAVSITGKRAEAERFLSLLSFGERGSRELEHV